MHSKQIKEYEFHQGHVRQEKQTLICVRGGNAEVEAQLI
jgi:hypothetical protein